MTIDTNKLPTPAYKTAEFTFVGALDNHEPVREEACGILEEWVWPDTREISYRICGGVSQFRDAQRSVFLIDDGRTVRPLYVTGWSGGRDHLFLGPFPVNINEDGTPRMRTDRDVQVDYSTWMLGPRRAYHLKITII